MKRFYFQTSQLSGILLLMLSLLVSACGEAVTSVSNNAPNFIPTITPANGQTTVATTNEATISTNPASTTIASNTVVVQSTSTVNSVPDSASTNIVVATTSSLPTTGDKITDTSTTAPPTTLSTSTPAPKTTSTTAATATVVPVSTPVSNDQGTDNNLPVGGFGQKAVCTAQNLAKSAGAGYNVVSEQTTTIPSVSEKPLKIVLIGKPFDSSADIYTELRGYVIASNCSTKGAYTLAPSDQLSEWKPEVEVRDIHNDGQQEIIVTGGRGAHWSLINVFVFDKKLGVFREQAFFGGDGGADLAVPDQFKAEIKDGAVSANRDYSLSQLLYQEIFKWSPEKQKYLQITSVVDLAFGKPDKLQYPNQVVLMYYDAINRKDYKTAYSYFSPKLQQSQSYEQFVKGFVTTKQVWISEMSLPSVETAGAAGIFDYKDGLYDVPLIITAVDDLGNGQTKQTQFKGKWTVNISGGVPYLNTPAISQLK